MAHRWLSRLPAHLLYLRDFSRSFFVGGIRSLGYRASTLEALRSILASLAPKRIACFGTSSGVFPALQYGLDLEADAVLALAGTTNLTASFNQHLRRVVDADRIQRAFPDAELDLRPLYERAKRPPATLYVYGAGNWDDVIHSERMFGLPSASFLKLDDFDNHNVTPELIRIGLFTRMLEWAATGRKFEVASAACD